MQEKSNLVLAFRGLVLGLAVFYFIWQFFTASPGFGVQFRYLTIWGLTGNLIVAAAMWSRSRGRTTYEFNALVSAVAVLNAMVLFLYWRLYFIDPALVNGSGRELNPFQEYYLHLGMAILQWIDAFFILGAFTKIRATLVRLMIIMLAYIAWIEAIVRPMNETPVGSITSGLPYPFLNDMDMMGRSTFYAVTITTALIFFAVMALVSWGLRRMRRAS